MALTSAVGKIPGGAATEVLANWLVRVEDPQLASYIAYKWSKRPDITAAARESLLSRVDGSRRLYLRLASGDPGARDEAEPLLNQKDISAIYWAALLAGLPHVPSQPAAPLLWQLASFHDPRVYPAEIIVRRSAIASLFYNELRVRYPLPEAEGD
ncbi:MAG TPA: hypothetical protein VJN18_01525 [Polyangiaceae bacterium]|nr:hypothetical protein [Polyangiaceae bacterium]